MNPYWDLTFVEFFQVFFSRIIHLFSGGDFAADEIQFFTLSCIAFCCGILGPLLALKKTTMLANSLSHTILLGLVISYLIIPAPFGSLSHLLLGAFCAALLTAAAMGLLTRFCRLQEDASVGLTFTVLFAIGVIIVSLYLRDVHLGVEAVMGNVDILRLDDLKLSLLLLLINSVFVFIFFWPLQILLFDLSFAQAKGVRINIFQGALLFLTAATCVGAFRAVGVLLVLSFLVSPYLVARLFVQRLSHLLLLSPMIGVLVSLIGVALSRHILTAYGLALSTGGMIATLLTLSYPLTKIFFLKKCKRLGRITAYEL